MISQNNKDEDALSRDKALAQARELFFCLHLCSLILLPHYRYPYACACQCLCRSGSQAFNLEVSPTNKSTMLFLY